MRLWPAQVTMTASTGWDYESTKKVGKVSTDWMQSYTGKKFHPLALQLDEIDKVDIAHALSMLCRYGGHTNKFYSVAEHCVLMSWAVRPENALAALLHDASEAYLIDLPRPVKRAWGFEEYRAAEDHALEAIFRVFGVDWPMPAEVKEADTRILLDERNAMMTNTPDAWECDGLQPLGIVIENWTPDLAKFMYLKRLAELTE